MPLDSLSPGAAARRHLATGALLAIALAAAPPGWSATPARSGAVLEDATRFAAVFDANGGAPSAPVLQSGYLDPGTPGIAIFTPYRIKDAANLARHVAAAPADYRHAIDVCLPVAQRMHDEVSATIAKVGTLLGSRDAAPAYFLFGADNSGGTADTDGLGIGLEVICKGVQTPEQAREVIREFVAHEMTHVFQDRSGVEMPQHDLLQHVLSEGFADFVMGQVLGADTRIDATRRAYGVAHEAELWQRLQADVAAGKGDEYWLYNTRTPPPGLPSDLGYWLGRRICESYYEHASDKAAAIRTLLLLRDARAIVDASGYRRSIGAPSIPASEASSTATPPASACASRAGASAALRRATSKVRHIPDESDPCAESTGVASRLPS